MRQSFEPTMHNEATKPMSVSAHAEAREWKGLSAPGEVPMKMLSDGGSTPPASTIMNRHRFSNIFIEKRELSFSKSLANAGFFFFKPPASNFRNF